MVSASRVNERVARGVTAGVGTMWAAYGFALLTLVSLPAAIRTRDSVVIVGWIAQTFLQLVLLPIIMVGQRLQAQDADALHSKIDALHDKVDAAS
ncbi:MAG: hypothetical protein NVS3B26_16520 [Mycobacteriales bacterium]